MIVEYEWDTIIINGCHLYLSILLFPSLSALLQMCLHYYCHTQLIHWMLSDWIHRCSCVTGCHTPWYLIYFVMSPDVQWSSRLPVAVPSPHSLPTRWLQRTLPSLSLPSISPVVCSAVWPVMSTGGVYVGGLSRQAYGRMASYRCATPLYYPLQINLTITVRISPTRMYNCRHLVTCILCATMHCRMSPLVFSFALWYTQHWVFYGPPCPHID